MSDEIKYEVGGEFRDSVLGTLIGTIVEATPKKRFVLLKTAGGSYGHWDIKTSLYHGGDSYYLPPTSPLKEGFSKKEEGVQWTDTHYEHYYTLTEDDIKLGKVKLDVYTVADVWKIGSKDDSGALWHTFKIFPRYGEKNSEEREIKAMYAQVKALAKIKGVVLED